MNRNSDSLSSITMRQNADSPIRFGLVGCGRVAPTHFKSIHSLGERGNLMAVCDTNPDSLRQAIEITGAVGYPELSMMLEQEDLDVISICTPSGLHAEQGIRAAKAGKHVVVEKPIDVNLQQAKRLIEACEENQVHLFPIFQNRLNTTVQLLKAAVEKGRFGNIYSITGNMIWKRTQEYYDSAAWRGTKAMDGGVFMNQGIHFVDIMRYIGGEIVDVKSICATLARNIETEDIGAAVFRYKSGAIGSIFVTALGRSDLEGSIMVLGEKGQVKLGGGCLNHIDIWDFDHEDLEMDTNANTADYQSKSIYGFGHLKEYVRVVNVLKKQVPPPDSLDALESLATLLKISP